MSCKLNRKSFCRNFENAAYFHNEVIETWAVASHHHFLDVSLSGIASVITESAWVSPLHVPILPCAHCRLHKWN